MVDGTAEEWMTQALDWDEFTSFRQWKIKSAIVPYLQTAIIYDNNEALNALLNIHTPPRYDFQRLVALCIEEDSPRCLHNLLVRDPALAGEILDPVTKETAIHTAARCNNLALSKMILNSGHCDVTHKDHLGALALHHASAHRDFPGVTTLVHILLGTEGYVYPFKKTSCCEFVNEPDDFGRTPLHIAIEYGNLEVVKLLVRHGARGDIRCEPHFTPPLVLAAKGNNPWIVSETLKATEDMSVRDAQGFTARDWNENLPQLTQIPSSIPQDIPDVAECMICKNIMLDPVVLMCGHIVCFSCASKSLHSGMCAFRCSIRTYRFNIDEEKVEEVITALDDPANGIVGRDLYRKREQLEYVSRAQVLLDSFTQHPHGGGRIYADIFNVCEIRYSYRVEGIRPDTMDVSVAFVWDTVVVFHKMASRGNPIVISAEHGLVTLQRYLEASLSSLYGIGFSLNEDNEMIVHTALQVTSCKTDALGYLTDAFCNHASVMNRHDELGSVAFVFPESDIDPSKLTESPADLRKVTQMVHAFQQKLSEAKSFHQVSEHRNGPLHMWVITSETLPDTTITFHEAVSMLAVCVPFCVKELRRRPELLMTLCRRRFTFCEESCATIAYDTINAAVVLRLTVFVGCVLEPYLARKVPVLKQMCINVDNLIQEHWRTHGTNLAVVPPEAGTLWNAPVQQHLEYFHRLLMQLVHRPKCRIAMLVAPKSTTHVLQVQRQLETFGAMTVLAVYGTTATLHSALTILNLVVLLGHEVHIQSFFFIFEGNGTTVHLRRPEGALIMNDDKTLPVRILSQATSHMALNGSCCRVLLDCDFTTPPPCEASFLNPMLTNGAACSKAPPFAFGYISNSKEFTAASKIPGWSEACEANIVVWQGRGLTPHILEYFSTEESFSATVDDLYLGLVQRTLPKSVNFVWNSPIVRLLPLFPSIKNADGPILHPMAVSLKSIAKSGRCGRYAVLDRSWRILGTISVRANHEVTEWLTALQHEDARNMASAVVFPLEAAIPVACTSAVLEICMPASLRACTKNDTEEECVLRVDGGISRIQESCDDVSTILTSPTIAQLHTGLCQASTTTYFLTRAGGSNTISVAAPIARIRNFGPRSAVPCAVKVSTQTFPFHWTHIAITRGAMHASHLSAPSPKSLPEQIAIVPEERFWEYLTPFFENEVGMINDAVDDMTGVIFVLSSHERARLVQRVQAVMRLITVRILSRGGVLRPTADLSWAYHYLAGPECDVNHYCSYVTLLRLGLLKLPDCPPLTAVHLQNNLIFAGMHQSFAPTIRIVVADYILRLQTLKTHHYRIVIDAIKKSTKKGRAVNYADVVHQQCGLWERGLRHEARLLRVYHAVFQILAEQDRIVSEYSPIHEIYSVLFRSPAGLCQKTFSLGLQPVGRLAGCLQIMLWGMACSSPGDRSVSPDLHLCVCEANRPAITRVPRSTIREIKVISTDIYLWFSKPTGVLCDIFCLDPLSGSHCTYFLNGVSLLEAHRIPINQGCADNERQNLPQYCIVRLRGDAGTFTLAIVS